MAERSNARNNASFSRGRLAVGLVLVAVVAGGIVFGLSKLRGAPSAGTLVYAARQGVFSRDLSSGESRKVASLPGDLEVAMPSPDGRYVAYASGQGQLWLADTEEGQRFEIAARFTVPLGWTPDGRLVAGELAGDRDLVAVDPEGGRDVLLSGGYETGSFPVWIDDTRFAIPVGEEEFVIVEGAGRSDPVPGRPLAASPDSAELLLVRDGDVYVAKVTDHEIDGGRRIFREAASFAASSPAGFVAIATEDGVHVFEGGTRSRRVVDRPVDWVGWGRAGAVLLYARDGAAYALNLADPTADPKRVTRRGTDLLPLLSLVVTP